ncbi:MAG: peptide deformylase [Gaiellaceae bacterium]
MHDHDHGPDHAHPHGEVLDDPLAEGRDDELEDVDLDPETEARRQLALAQIRQYGDSALRLKAHEVTEFDDDLQRLIDRMTVLMHDARGVGLAATQVGVLRRVFVFQPSPERDPVAVVNPRITERGPEMSVEEEGCLSLQGVRVPVERATTVTIEAQDASGAPVTYDFEEYEARVAQHELDHLDGVLIIDHTDDEHRKQALAVLRPRAVLR